MNQFALNSRSFESRKPFVLLATALMFAAVSVFGSPAVFAQDTQEKDKTESKKQDEQSPPKSDGKDQKDNSKPIENKELKQEKEKPKSDEKKAKPADPKNEKTKPKVDETQDEKKIDPAKPSENSKPEKQEPKKQKNDEKKPENQSDEKMDPKTDPKKSETKAVDAKKDKPAQIRRLNKESRQMLALFRPITTEAAKSTVEVLAGKRQVALGTVVDEKGFILTKASELRGSIVCKLYDGRTLPATIHGLSNETDLAMLKIDAENLAPVTWSPVEVPPVGNWVITPGIAQDPIAFGIVSVRPREIKPAKGFFGVELRDREEKDGVRVIRVVADSPAEAAGVMVNDIVIKVDDKSTPTREILVESISRNPPGTKVKITIRRTENDKATDIDLIVRLANKAKANPNFQRSMNQNTMGGRLSNRRLDFQVAFQHDSVLTPKECGGPILNLNGEVIGINIARSGRVESLALPASLILPVVEKLMTGEFTPEIVNKKEIDELQKELAELDSKSKGLPKNTGRLKTKFDRDSAKGEMLKKVIEDLQAQLDEIEKSRGEAKSKLDTASKRLSQIEKDRERIEDQLRKLTTGLR